MSVATPSRVQASAVIALGLLGLLMGAACISPEVASALALGLILVVGFPHGADDVTLLRRLAELSPVGIGYHVFGYLSLMALTLALWWWWPLVALLGFILVSVAHFGYDHAVGLGIRGLSAQVYALSWGTFVLLAPLTWHPADLVPVVEQMSGYTLSAGVLSAGAGLAAGSGGLCLLLLPLLRTQLPRGLAYAEVLQLAALTGLYLALPSLWGFAIFFVGVHAVTSVYNQISWGEVHVEREGLITFLRRGAPYAVAAIAAIAGLLWWVDVEVLGAAGLSTFFILVSAFTVPHAVVIHAGALRFSSSHKFTPRASTVKSGAT